MKRDRTGRSDEFDVDEFCMLMEGIDKVEDGVDEIIKYNESKMEFFEKDLTTYSILFNILSMFNLLIGEADLYKFEMVLVNYAVRAGLIDQETVNLWKGEETDGE